MKENNRKPPEYYVPTKLGAFISIQSKPEVLKIAPGRYRIYLNKSNIVTLNSFKIKLTDLERKKEVVISNYRFSIGIGSGIKLNNLFEFEIDKFGEYLLEFINPEDLVARRSQLLLTSLLLPAVRPDKIYITIEKL